MKIVVVLCCVLALAHAKPAPPILRQDAPTLVELLEKYKDAKAAAAGAPDDDALKATAKEAEDALNAAKDAATDEEKKEVDKAIGAIDALAVANALPEDDPTKADAVTKAQEELTAAETALKAAPADPAPPANPADPPADPAPADPAPADPADPADAPADPADPADAPPTSTNTTDNTTNTTSTNTTSTNTTNTTTTNTTSTNTTNTTTTNTTSTNTTNTSTNTTITNATDITNITDTTNTTTTEEPVTSTQKLQETADIAGLDCVTEGPVIGASLTIPPEEDPPSNVVTDRYGSPIKDSTVIEYKLPRQTVFIHSETWRTYFTRPATKANCLCQTRGPLSPFKLIGNLHFKNIKVPKHKRRFEDPSKGVTDCPPCNCADCFTTTVASEKRKKVC